MKVVSGLRFIQRESKRILQQQTMEVFLVKDAFGSVTGTNNVLGEWEDVPMHEDEKPEKEELADNLANSGQ